jgi:hypothetical protein
MNREDERNMLADRAQIRFAKLLAVAAFAALAFALLTGCQLFSSKKGGIRAPHSTPELYGALHAAEARLGMTHRTGSIRVEFREGTHPSRHGWSGVPADGGILGGVTSAGGAILLYLTGGKVHPHNAEHEMAHSILYSRGVPGEQHHATMKKAGFQW